MIDKGGCQDCRQSFGNLLMCRIIVPRLKDWKGDFFKYAFTFAVFLRAVLGPCIRELEDITRRLVVLVLYPPPVVCLYDSDVAGRTA